MLTQRLLAGSSNEEKLHFFIFTMMVNMGGAAFCEKMASTLIMIEEAYRRGSVDVGTFIQDISSIVTCRVEKASPMNQGDLKLLQEFLVTVFDKLYDLDKNNFDENSIRLISSISQIMKRNEVWTQAVGLALTSPTILLSLGYPEKISPQEVSLDCKKLQNIGFRAFVQSLCQLFIRIFSRSIRSNEAGDVNGGNDLPVEIPARAEFKVSNAEIDFSTTPLYVNELKSLQKQRESQCDSKVGNKKQRVRNI